MQQELHCILLLGAYFLQVLATLFPMTPTVYLSATLRRQKKTISLQRAKCDRFIKISPVLIAATGTLRPATSSLSAALSFLSCSTYENKASVAESSLEV